MAQDELRLDEAAQKLGLLWEGQAREWSEEVCTRIYKEHRARFQDPEKHAERASLIEREIEYALSNDLRERMLSALPEALDELSLFSADQKEQIVAQVRLWVLAIPMSISVSLAPQLRTLEPKKSGGLIAVFALLGVMLSNMLRLSESFATVFALVVGGLGAMLLTQWQQQALAAGQASTLHRKVFEWVSVSTHQSTSLLDQPTVVLTKTIIALGHTVAILFRAAAQVERSKQEQRQEDTDILQHIFQRCVDGFAEVHYGELKRDPERALDACIKLSSDLEVAGIVVKSVERGEDYSTSMEAHFTHRGRIEEGEPVMMIHPAWLYQGRLLAKGTIKRDRRRRKA